MPGPSNRKLIFGCGYLGTRVAKRWIAQGDTVYAVTRSEHRAAELRGHGIEPIVANLNQGPIADLPDVDSVLYSVGFDGTGDESVHEVFAEGLQTALDSLTSTPGRVIYTSTIGVYAQNDGSWVDENSTCEPTREGGKAALAAETILADHPRGENRVTLRLAGLYGPGRVPYQQLIRDGKPVPAAEHGHLNLIHVDDAAAVVVACESGGTNPPRLYVVADGTPTTRRDYYTDVARLLKSPVPTFIEPASDTHRGDRASSDKRVFCDRMLKELNLSVQFPSYQHGLLSILGARPTSELLPG